jgi:hypothetical protein
MSNEFTDVSFPYIQDPEEQLRCEVCGCIIEAEDNGLCITCVQIAADMKWGIYEPI